MRPQSGLGIGVLVLGITGVLITGLALGQSRSVADRNEQVRIRKMVGAGARILVETPKYQAATSLAGGVKPTQRWGKITVYYDTTQEWTDELTFQYFVMTRKTEGAKASFSLYTTTVRYMDVRRGANHESAVFLRPTAIERYGDVIAAAVEISIGGKVVAEETHIEGAPRMPERWWRQSAVIESKDVVARDGYLLDRSRSPFALINIDDYEAVKQ
jgi:hypothetical protein